jgi:hypothetical protein
VDAPLTTNLFVSNLPLDCPVDEFVSLFVKFGDVASYRIAWPRTPEEVSTLHTHAHTTVHHTITSLTPTQPSHTHPLLTVRLSSGFCVGACSGSCSCQCQRVCGVHDAKARRTRDQVNNTHTNMTPTRNIHTTTQQRQSRPHRASTHHHLPLLAVLLPAVVCVCVLVVQGVERCDVARCGVACELGQAHPPPIETDGHSTSTRHQQHQSAQQPDTSHTLIPPPLHTMTLMMV